MQISKTYATAGTTFRSVHRTMVAVLIIFATVHMANHFAGLASVSSHLKVMEKLRTVYRWPAIEAALLACVAVQIASGLVLLRRGWKTRSGVVAWVQAASGAYLAFFLLMHVAAALYGRVALGLDTNFYFAAAGMHVAPYAYFFGPYYFLAVLSLFAHIGCALSWSISRSPRLRMLTVAGFVCIGTVASALIVATLMGLIHEYAIPQEYLNTFLAGSGAG
jgi:hypothetical protein